MHIRSLRVVDMPPLVPGRELEFTPELNLVWGPNESGKSTVFQGVVGSMYGYQLVAPISIGDRSGVALTLELQGIPYECLRRTKHSGTRQKATQGDPRVSGPNVEWSKDEAQDFLRRAMQGLGYEAWLGLFAIRATHLESSQSMVGGKQEFLALQLRHVAGLAGANDAAMRQALETERARFLSPTATGKLSKGGALKKALNEKKEAAARERQARKAQSGAAQLARELQRLESQLDQERGRLEGAQARFTRLERQAQLLPRILILSRRQEERRGLCVPTLPEGLNQQSWEAQVVKLQEINEDLEDGRAVLEQKQGRAQEKAQGAEEDLALAEQSSSLLVALDELALARASEEQAQSECDELRSKGARLRELVKGGPRELAQWDEEKASRLDRAIVLAEAPDTPAQSAKPLVLWLALAFAGIGFLLLFPMPWPLWGGVAWGLGLLFMAQRSAKANTRPASNADLEEALRALDLPRELSPDSARSCMDNLRTWVELATQGAMLESVRSRREADRLEKQKALETRFRVLDLDLGSPKEWKRRAEAAILDAQRRIDARQRMAEEVLEAQAEVDGLTQRLGRYQRQREDWLKALGLEDGSAVPELLDKARRTLDLDQQIRDLEQELEALTPEERATLAALDEDELALELQDLEARQGTAQAQVDAMHEDLGRLGEKMKQASEDEALEDARAAKQQAQAQIDALAPEAAVAYLAEQAFEQSLVALEDQAPPALLIRAREIFQGISGRGIGKALGAIDLTVPVGGAQVGEDSLSTGTRHQLYLSLRLAAIEARVASHGPLPVLLDDVFAHYDDERLARSLECIAALAQHTQVILTSCHERVREALAEVSHCRVLDLTP